MTVFPQRPFFILYKKVQVKLADIDFSMSAKVGYEWCIREWVNNPKETLLTRCFVIWQRHRSATLIMVIVIKMETRVLTTLTKKPSENIVEKGRLVDCIVFNVVFNGISCISRRPVYLSMLS